MGLDGTWMGRMVQGPMGRDETDADRWDEWDECGGLISLM